MGPKEYVKVKRFAQGHNTQALTGFKLMTHDPWVRSSISISKLLVLLTSTMKPSVICPEYEIKKKTVFTVLNQSCRTCIAAICFIPGILGKMAHNDLFGNPTCNRCIWNPWLWTSVCHYLCAMKCYYVTEKKDQVCMNHSTTTCNFTHLFVREKNNS